MADIAALTQLIEPEATALGLAVVRVKMFGGTSDPTLQVMAERPDTRQLDLGDCEKISRRLSEVFDALEADGCDPIDGAYRLEVSSPGIDRPLTREKDYVRWAGHLARLETMQPVEGRRRFKGTLLGFENGTVRLRLEDGKEADVPLDQIFRAKLEITDALLDEHRRAQEGAEQSH